MATPEQPFKRRWHRRYPPNAASTYRSVDEERNAVRMHNLAKCALILCAIGRPPGEFWYADSRVRYACDVLGWDLDFAFNWANVNIGFAPTWEP